VREPKVCDLTFITCGCSRNRCSRPASAGFVRSKSLISKKIDRPQPVPSNQLDRPQAFRLEAITHNSIFADYLHRRIPPTKFATKLSKIAASFSTRQNPTFVINLTKIGSTLSPEEHRLHA